MFNALQPGEYKHQMSKVNKLRGEGKNYYN